MRKTSLIRVAICMGINDYYEHGIARGVVRYAKQREDWKLYGYGWMFRRLEDLSRWEGEGIITRAESPGEAEQIRALNLPVVDVAGAYTGLGFHQVSNDDYITGKRAGAYLKSRGFTRFGFCGVTRVGWSAKRKEGFLKGAEITSLKNLPVFEQPLSWWENLEDPELLGEWLLSLPRPAAVFACNDTAGVKITGLCRRFKIPVPQELAILGVDNEDILCELSHPSLSSIQLDCEEIGYRAAELLDSLISRDIPSGGYRSEILIQPGRIMERDTTNIFVCGDPQVQKAVTYIRSRYRTSLSVPQIASHVNASRRSLEIKFRSLLGKSIHQCILESRMSHAKNQLTSTDKTIAAAAEEAGYNSIQRFHQAFLKETGMTPGSYRKRNRRG